MTSQIVLKVDEIMKMVYHRNVKFDVMERGIVVTILFEYRGHFQPLWGCRFCTYECISVICQPIGTKSGIDIELAKGFPLKENESIVLLPWE